MKKLNSKYRSIDPGSPLGPYRYGSGMDWQPLWLQRFSLSEHLKVREVSHIASLWRTLVGMTAVHSPRSGYIYIERHFSEDTPIPLEHANDVLGFFLGLGALERPFNDDHTYCVLDWQRDYMASNEEILKWEISRGVFDGSEDLIPDGFKQFAARLQALLVR
jgi:hypothetical protein